MRIIELLQSTLTVVGWVERSETQQMPRHVGFRPSTQPTKIKLILFTIKGAVEPNFFRPTNQILEYYSFPTRKLPLRRHRSRGAEEKNYSSNLTLGRE